MEPFEGVFVFEEEKVGVVELVGETDLNGGDDFLHPPCPVSRLTLIQ